MLAGHERIAELEAELAEEARQADEAVDSCRERIAELEADLKVAKHLNAKWMDERTMALMDKEQAEAELTVPLPDWEHMLTDPPVRCLGCYVVAELAALKATPREPLPGEIDHEMLRQHNEALQAELAALKGRRCETCASADSMVDPHNPTHIYVCTNEDSVCFECWLVRDSDFACNRWTARAEEGGES
jgi:hypothetical protein